MKINIMSIRNHIAYMDIAKINLARFTIDNFIPAIWSAQLLVTLKEALVYGQEFVINRDYEGDISAFGDTVKINGIGTVTVGDYVKNTNISDPEALADTSRTLLIDQSKFFNFQIDDIDTAQQKPKVMSQAMRESAFALAKVADTFIANNFVDIALANGLGSTGSPIVFTKVTDAYERLVDLGIILDENNVPTMDRWVVVPPWYHGLLLKDDRFIKAGDLSSERTRMNGMVGEAAGFTIMKSNQVPNTAGTEYRVIAGWNGAWSFAEQINDTEAYRPEKRFADAMKGLHLYGAKVVRPTALALLTVNRPVL